MEIYNSLQGNIYYRKEFINRIKKTYDCSQKKKEIYNSLQGNISYMMDFIFRIRKTYDCSQRNNNI